MKKPIRLFLFLIIATIGFVAIAYTHNVSKTITKEDADYIHKIVSLYGNHWEDVSKHKTFEEEIADIRTIQASVLQLTPIQKQIPRNQTRNPKDLYDLRYAQCSDRSRAIDKMLRLAGFKTRVASVYGTSKTGSAIKSLLSNDKNLVRSHSVVEVKTQKGWMIVDTNDLWLSLDEDMRPISLEEWQHLLSNKNYEWNTSNTGEIYWLLKEPYTYVYGLYSRHGYFYPPYNPLPDINWLELTFNMF